MREQVAFYLRSNPFDCHFYKRSFQQLGPFLSIVVTADPGQQANAGCWVEVRDLDWKESLEGLRRRGLSVVSQTINRFSSGGVRVTC